MNYLRKFKLGATDTINADMQGLEVGRFAVQQGLFDPTLSGQLASQGHSKNSTTYINESFYRQHLPYH